jgi:hypothetical protein
MAPLWTLQKGVVVWNIWMEWNDAIFISSPQSDFGLGHQILEGLLITGGFNGSIIYETLPNFKGVLASFFLSLIRCDAYIHLFVHGMG